MSDLGEVGYRAYAASTGGKCEQGNDDVDPWFSRKGKAMPAWADLPPHVVKAWNDAGKAIAKKVYEVVNDVEPCPETVPAPAGYPYDR